jgi:CubicO group peptidase (beta-lactamase class C family)
MRRMMLALALLLVARPALACAPPANTRALDDIVRRALKIWNVPGVAVAVVRGDEVVYLKGHGVREVGKKAPVTHDTVFPLASCSKPFTSAALAILADEGKLGWDDPVRKHVPFFRLADPRADRQVALRDLLCHRTGLAGHNLLWYRSPWPPEEVVRRAGRLPLDRPFRSTFQYQSTMFTAAGLAVSSAAREPWAAFVEKRLLAPLGMKRTVFTSTAALKLADVASPHRLDERIRPEVMERYPMPVPDAAGSVHSTARDLAKWLQFQMGDGTVGKKRIVSAAGLAETHKPHMLIRPKPLDRELFPDTTELRYALAWVVLDYRGHRLISHGGAIDGFRIHLVMVPKEKVGVVLLCNLDQTYMNLSLSNMLLDVMLDLPRKDWHVIHRAALGRAQRAAQESERARRAARHRGTRPTRELSAYAGDYDHPAYGRVRVRLERGVLVWSWSDVRGPLEHYEYDTFTLGAAPVGPGEVEFKLDPAGAVTALKVGGNLNVEFRKPSPKRKR